MLNISAVVSGWAATGAATIASIANADLSMAGN
jgi:hypothetical protein